MGVFAIDSVARQNQASKATVHWLLDPEVAVAVAIGSVYLSLAMMVATRVDCSQERTIVVDKTKLSHGVGKRYQRREVYSSVS